MLKSELEIRIRRLETGLDRFTGIDWIQKVGDIAEIKEAALEMSSETEALCRGRVAQNKVAVLDADISAAIAGKNSPIAFERAYRTLRHWITPALPGQRRDLASNVRAHTKDR